MPALNDPLPYHGLPYADDEQAKEFLRGTTCVVDMSGSTGVQFNAPASLLSRLSAPIEALVKGVVNGTKASASIDVDDEGLFYRFCQFVFTGTYDEFSKLENEDRADCLERIAPSIAETCIESIAPVRVGSGKSSSGFQFGGRSQSSASTGLFGTSETTGGGGLFATSGSNAQVPASTGLFGTSETTGGGGLFATSGSNAQAPASTGTFGAFGATGGGGLFGSSGSNAQAPASTGLFQTSKSESQAPASTGLFGSSSLFGASETTRGSGSASVQSGLQLPYSLLSCREALNKITTSEPRPKKRKREESDDSDGDFRLLFKSRAISTFLQNSDQTYFSPPTFDGRRRSFENVLGHAKTWHFAEKYAINSLMNVSRLRFTRELARWVIDDFEFVTDFGQVVSFLYHSRSEDKTLQLLIAQFAACIVTDTKSFDSWGALTNDVPAFHKDLAHALIEAHCS